MLMQYPVGGIKKEPTPPLCGAGLVLGALRMGDMDELNRAGFNQARLNQAALWALGLR